MKGLNELQSLDLQGTKVTGAGLANLKGLSKLRWLHLAGTKVTDSGLEYLKGLTELQCLYWREPRSPTPGWQT